VVHGPRIIDTREPNKLVEVKVTREKLGRRDEDSLFHGGNSGSYKISSQSMVNGC
jgi:hypothetical protein